MRKQTGRWYVRSFIADVLRDRQMTQGDLARRLQCDRKDISAYVRGKVLPNVARALEIGRALDATIDQLWRLERVESKS